MIPLHDNIPTRRFPIVTTLLIALNVLAFLADKFTGGYEVVPVRTQLGVVNVRHFVGGLAQNYSLIPAEFTTNPMAAWPQVIGSMFLHSNWLHIGGNMLYLWVFGNNVEDTLGRVRFTLFYLVCGIGAAAAQIYTDPASQTPMIGASGAVAGVMGAYLVLFPHAQILSIVPIFLFGLITEVSALIVIGFWALLQFVNVNWLGGGMLHGGGVAYFAHIGGFAAGIVIILLLGGRRLLENKGEPEFEAHYDR